MRVLGIALGCTVYGAGCFVAGFAAAFYVDKQITGGLK
jgi:hypothetical protein